MHDFTTCTPDRISMYLRRGTVIWAPLDRRPKYSRGQKGDPLVYVSPNGRDESIFEPTVISVEREYTGIACVIPQDVYTVEWDYLIVMSVAKSGSVLFATPMRLPLPNAFDLFREACLNQCAKYDNGFDRCRAVASVMSPNESGRRVQMLYSRVKDHYYVYDPAIFPSQRQVHQS